MFDMHQVPVSDNYFAALNSAVFSDGSFVYIPKGVRCPMEISTYFRINASETGQVWSCIQWFYFLVLKAMVTYIVCVISR
jgi:Fe-S cluster assembly scaffold protein SufB